MKIKFTSGTIIREDADFLTMRLYDANGKQVYAATLDEVAACEYIMKYNNIKLVEAATS